MMELFEKVILTALTGGFVLIGVASIIALVCGIDSDERISNKRKGE